MELQLRWCFSKTLLVAAALASPSALPAPSLAAAFKWSTMQSLSPLDDSYALVASHLDLSLTSAPAATLSHWLRSQSLLPDNCEPQLQGQKSTGETAHYTFTVACLSGLVLGTSWQLHTFQDRLVMVSESAIWSASVLKPSSERDLINLQLIFTPPADGDLILQQKRGLVPGTLEEAWEQVVVGAKSKQRELRLVSVANGSIIARQLQQFDAIVFDVFATNQQETSLTTVSVATLGNGHLDSPEGVRAFGSDKSSSRLALKSTEPDEDLRGRYPAHDPASAPFFDQLQGFYAADKAQKWFSRRFGFKMDSGGMDIFMDSLQDKTPNNARYQPAVGNGSAALIIGQGDGVSFRNLGRDTDVIFHEFAHHILYRSLKVSYGETGILHEGTADYFAYAINGDPFLAESVRIGSPYLRTAKLGTDRRFDDAKIPLGMHELGQYWSAVLWAIREEIGAEAMDTIVYQAIDYLPAAATIADFFEGLLSADRDLFPEQQDAPSKPRFGLHQCSILRHGIDRGFAASLGKIDGGPCELDLQTLAEESRLLRNGNSDDSGEELSEENNLFKGCGTIGGRSNSVSAGCWFIIPLMLLLLSSRGRRTRVFKATMGAIGQPH